MVGCASCTQTRCRNDNRIAKTLLLAALASNTTVFEELTATRLVQLNHGTLKSPVPGDILLDAVGAHAVGSAPVLAERFAALREEHEEEALGPLMRLAELHARRRDDSPLWDAVGRLLDELGHEAGTEGEANGEANGETSR